MFLEPDEHIIIMEDDLYTPFSIDELKMLEDAGIKTVEIPHAIYIEDSLDAIDKRLETTLKTNMKILLPVFYQRNIKEINYNDKYVGTDIDLFMYDLMFHYYDLKDRIQFIYALPEGGEFLWDAMRTDDFPYSDEQVISFIIERQKILEKQHNEIWLHLHNFLGDPNNWNNTHLPFLYEALRNEFKNTAFYSVQYAHFYVGGTTPTNKNGQEKIKEYTEKFGIKFFVGSEYCEGLDKNFDLAMEQGVYGFLTAPLHSENPIKHTHIEQWMVERLKETNAKFNAKN